MDINYTLKREQISLHNALNAPSAAARIVHRKLARAYGALLATSSYPHASARVDALAVVPRSDGDTREVGKDLSARAVGGWSQT